MFFFKLLSILAHELGAFENLLISIVFIIDTKFTGDPSGNRFREDFKERLDGFFGAAESQCKRNGLGETRELIGNFLKVLGDMEVDVALKADLRTPALLVLAGNIGCDPGFLIRVSLRADVIRALSLCSTATIKRGVSSNSPVNIPVFVVVSTSTTLGTRISRGRTSHIPSGRQENITRPRPVDSQLDKKSRT